MRGRAKRTRTPHVVLNRSLCEACWRCVAACPQSVLGRVDFLSHKHAVVDSADDCIGCGACVRACSSGALAKRDAA